MSRQRLIQVLVAGGAGIVALALAGFFFFTTSVPDVSNSSKADAQQALADAGFSVAGVVEEFSVKDPRGTVISQSPSGGSRVLKGQDVTLTISRGPAVTVPDLSGVSVGAAQTALTALNLKFDTDSAISATVPKGQIISQDPSPGSQVEEDSRVALVISKGPPVETVTVTIDNSDLVLSSDLTCEIQTILWQSVYNDSAIVGSNGQTLSSISGRWQADPGNGYYLPCLVIGTFPDVPTTEDRYKLNLNAEGTDASEWYSNREMQDSGWTLKFR